MNEKLATYSSSVTTAFGKIASALNGCKTVKGSTGGTAATGTIGQMSFPHYGNQSIAYAVQLSAGGSSLAATIVIVRVGSTVMGFDEENAGGPVSVSQFEHFTNLAVSKLSH